MQKSWVCAEVNARRERGLIDRAVDATTHMDAVTAASRSLHPHFLGFTNLPYLGLCDYCQASALRKDWAASSG
jgi:hypothetical protein